LQLQIERRLHWPAWWVALGLALILTAFAAAGTFASGDLRLARTIQEAQGIDVLQPPSEALYRFGLSPVFPLVALSAAGIALLARNYLGGGFILIAAASRPLGTIIKEIVERPRPSEGLVPYVEGASGFSYPSGHVFGTVLLVGFIAYLLIEKQRSVRRQLLIAGSAAGFMLLMGLQRVYAGAHWPTDTLGAYLWGGLVLFGLIRAYRQASSLLQARSEA
jgi:undecaprenyl-diphosphatase